MQLSELVVAIRQDPRAFIEPVDPNHLDAFFVGYKYVNMALHKPLKKLTKRFAGASGAVSFTRAYLRFEPTEAIDRLMKELEDILVKLPLDAFEEGPVAREPPVALVVRCAQDGGRIGMAIGEPTILWLFNYVQGVLAAQRAWNQDLARKHEQQLADFERWLQRRYDEPDARWHRIIRAYKGPCAEGVLKFAELWTEWEGTVARSAE